jgi:hypothetical protein
MNGPGMEVSGLETAPGGLALPAQNLTDVVGQAFANDKFLLIVERDEPSVAAQGRHFSDMIDVHKRIAVHPPKAGPLQPFLDLPKALRGEVALPGSDNPDDFAVSLKGQDLRGIQKEVLVAGPANDLEEPRGNLDAGDLLQPYQVLRGFRLAVDQSRDRATAGGAAAPPA